MSTKPNFSFEDQYKGLVCGIDEVGRGPLAGPVVAAAVVIRRDEMPRAVLEQINDSKKLTARKREYLFNQIQEFSYISIAECSVVEIDKINILQASLRAMEKAFRGLAVLPATALVDGNQAPKLPCTIKTIVRGDGRSLSIAAASIVAKHYRDTLMTRIANDFPHYGWETNAGYGTARHIKALKIHGVTIHHRRTFSPVLKQLVKEPSVKN
ncbi:MAG: ribonuclease HII [Alphaproteobacteria bacterium]|nr:ribonuclease HII [Alphaproteobacteria bacterium]